MAIELLAHRGAWKEAKEKNSLLAFDRALRHGFGIETDVRDRDGTPVISHDPARQEALPLESLLEEYTRLGSDSTLALNVKATGLAELVYDVLRAYSIDNFFVFDMSIPDTLDYAKLGICFYSRQSELEPNPVLYEDCSGVWLDSFRRDWFDEVVIEEHLSRGKSVCIVSPELHGRSHNRVWQMLRAFEACANSLLLCTDHPQSF